MRIRQEPRHEIMGRLLRFWVGMDCVGSQPCVMMVLRYAMTITPTAIRVLMIGITMDIGFSWFFGNGDYSSSC